MKRLARFAIGFALVVGALYLIYKVSYPDYTYRYRLELTLEVDGKAHTGSSVIEVKWTGGPRISPFGIYYAYPSLRGQAPIIDLGDSRIVIASLTAGGNRGDEDGIGALWICARAFDSNSSTGELSKLPRLTGRRDLQPNGWPRLILLPDRLDPNRLQAFRASEAESVFGPGARFTSAFVEITREPIVIDIDKRLPWYPSWREEKQRQRGFSGSPQAIILWPSMLIGDAS